MTTISALLLVAVVIIFLLLAIIGSTLNELTGTELELGWSEEAVTTQKGIISRLEGQLDEFEPLGTPAALSSVLDLLTEELLKERAKQIDWQKETKEAYDSVEILTQQTKDLRAKVVKAERLYKNMNARALRSEKKLAKLEKK
jgi:hypothetical protein